MEGAGRRPGHGLAGRAHVAVTRRRDRTPGTSSQVWLATSPVLCNLGGEIHVTRTRSQRTLCSHTRGGEEGWCVRLDAENDMLLFTSRHAENDMLKTGRFLSRLRKIRFSHRAISDLVRGCCVAHFILTNLQTLYHSPKY